MKRRTLSVVLILLLGISASCQTSSPTQPEAESGVVEVTRIITAEVTRLATVQAPVEVTREVFVEITVPLPPPPGSADSPILLLFSPLYEPTVTAARAGALADTLAAATGLTFELRLPATHAETVTLACAEPRRTVAFLSALEYALATAECPATAALAGLRNGLPWSAAMLLVPQNAGVQTLADLAGRRWGLADHRDLAAGFYFEALLAEQDVAVGSVTELTSDAAAVLALSQGRVDFVTAAFTPPLLPYNERIWRYGEDDPELWRRTGQMPARSGIGFVVVNGYVEDGGFQVRDARSTVLDVLPTIFADTRIAQLSAQIPNDAVALGAEFPLATARQIINALLTLTQTAACSASLCADDFFAWEGATAVEDPFYDAVRFIVRARDLSPEDVFDYLGR